MDFCPRIDGTKARNPWVARRCEEILEASRVEPPPPRRRTRHWVFQKRFVRPPGPTALDAQGEIVTASNAPARTTNVPRAEPRRVFRCSPAAVCGRFPMRALLGVEQVHDKSTGRNRRGIGIRRSGSDGNGDAIGKFQSRWRDDDYSGISPQRK